MHSLFEIFLKNFHIVFSKQEIEISPTKWIFIGYFKVQFFAAVCRVELKSGAHRIDLECIAKYVM